MKRSESRLWLHWPFLFWKTNPVFINKFWREIPRREMILFLLGVFFTFSIIGYIIDLWGGARYRWDYLALLVLITGFVAAGYAYTGLFRRFGLLVIFVLLHVSLILFLETIPSEQRTTSQSHLMVVGSLILVHLILGYNFFTLFITRVGDRIGRIRQELEMGQKMHRVLVPPLSGKVGYFEVFGRSIPAQEIGGDLMDMVTAPGVFTAYVADVSGHGISAGLLMGAVKSAVRTALQQRPSLEMLLRSINPVIQSMKERTMFVTFAGVQFDVNRHLAEVVTAGHPPVLYYERKTRTVHTIAIRQLPVGSAFQSHFQTRVVHYNLGDIFVLFTDGILETLRGGLDILDVEELARTLKEHSAESLEIIYQQLISTAHRKGQAIDDQTLLIIRCMG